jgi:hypothetical protein
MPPAPLNQPYRGNGSDRPVGIPLPPQDLPLFRSVQLRKTWHYVSFWSRELSFCAARVKVGPLQQEYWGIWDRNARQFRQASHVFGSQVHLHPKGIQVVDGDVRLKLALGIVSVSKFIGRPVPPTSGRTKIIHAMLVESFSTETPDVKCQA